MVYPILTYGLQEEANAVSKKFSELADEARETWSDDAKRVNEAAARVFAAEMDARATLGVELANLRTAQNLTQFDLQQLSGVQQAEISRIERGAGNPTLGTVEKLTNALGGRLAIVE